MASKMSLYLVRFSLPDGEHTMRVCSQDSVVKQHMQHMADAHNGAVEGSEMKILEIKKMNSPEEFEKAMEEIRAKNPDRPLAGDIFPDNPNRILSEPIPPLES